jgi:cytochrome c-type biogenesis protein CcmH/NrfF
MCPVCGTPLGLATEAPQAQRERELIERLIDDCRSKGEIKARLAAEFGDEVLALPDDEGFELAAWLVPGLAILLGASAVGVAALRWRRRRDGDRPLAPAGPSERLDADLDRYDL